MAGLIAPLASGADGLYDEVPLFLEIAVPTGGSEDKCYIPLYEEAADHPDDAGYAYALTGVRYACMRGKNGSQKSDDSLHGSCRL